MGNKNLQINSENVHTVLKEKMHEPFMKGYSVLVTDVINELGVEGSKEEVRHPSCPCYSRAPFSSNSDSPFLLSLF